MNEPFFTNDTIVFGLLALCIGFVFITSNSSYKVWKTFYNYVPAVLMCYLLPSFLSSFNLVSDAHSQVYFVASRYLLPASLVLMTLSIDLKAIAQLGPKALIMFFTGTFGIIVGGPLAIILVSIIAPETIGGTDFDAIWRGLSTIAGSWIGGGANQAAMLEIFKYNPEKYGGMVLIDIVIANIWLAVLLLGVGKTKRIDRWLKADTSAIEVLKEKVSVFTEKITRIPTLNDYMIIMAIAFSSVGIAHLTGDFLSDFLNSHYSWVQNKRSFFSFMGSSFFWMIVMATLIGIGLSFTKAKNYEGAGASKFGSVFIYLLVATIGMKMDLTKIFENPGLILIGIIWMLIHAVVLIAVAKLIKAPYFFLAVGSQANVGGAASAPVIAAEFHPSLASVGVLLAVLGYAVGTAGALFCAYLMEIASKI